MSVHNLRPLRSVDEDESMHPCTVVLNRWEWSVVYTLLGKNPSGTVRDLAASIFSQVDHPSQQAPR